LNHLLFDHVYTDKTFFTVLLWCNIDHDVIQSLTAILLKDAFYCFQVVLFKQLLLPSGIVKNVGELRSFH
jgi:hypothetical protein